MNNTDFHIWLKIFVRRITLIFAFNCVLGAYLLSFHDWGSEHTAISLFLILNLSAYFAIPDSRIFKERKAIDKQPPE